MSLLRWKDEYLTQVEEIDGQHRRLAQHINGIHDLLRSGRGQAALAEALGELVSYTKFHFDSEDALMEKTAYGKREEHVFEHKRLLNEIIELRRSIQDGHTVASVEVIRFLKNWLLTHFQGADKLLAQHLLARPAKR
jgi:hemerythrin